MIYIKVLVLIKKHQIPISLTLTRNIIALTKLIICPVYSGQNSLNLTFLINDRVHFPHDTS